MSEADYRKTKKRVDYLRKQVDQAEGSLETLMVQLKEEFDVDTLEEAEEQLEEMKTSLGKLTRKLAKSEAAFQEKWSDVLEEED